MRSRYPPALLLLALLLSARTWGQGVNPQGVPDSGGDPSSILPPQARVPVGVILVKGAWSSASDSVTPVPEGATVANGVFTDPYFGMTYKLPPDWTEKYEGPPPSDGGRYVLAQITPAKTFKGAARGSILITAQDMFFTATTANNAAELINYMKDHLQADYTVEIPPIETKIAGHSFGFFAYWSPVAQLHWYVLATEVRCHAVEIVLTSRDTRLLKSLMLDLNKMRLPAGTGSSVATGEGGVPDCVKDYARDENILARIDPVFTEHRFNPVPVRIIIDKNGKIKQIHFLSAFADQAKVISDALLKWRFKPYRRNGQPIQVETGVIFGRAPGLESR